MVESKYYETKDRMGSYKKQGAQQFDLEKKEADGRGLQEKLKQAEERAEELERELNKMKRESQAAALLEEMGMSAVFAEYLAAESEEETQQRVEKFAEEFNRAVSMAVRKKTPGYAPMEGERELKDDFLRGFYKR